MRPPGRNARAPLVAEGTLAEREESELHALVCMPLPATRDTTEFAPLFPHREPRRVTLTEDVVGAFGKTTELSAGASVVNALLRDPSFRPTAVTTTESSEWTFPLSTDLTTTELSLIQDAVGETEPPIRENGEVGKEP